MLPLTPRAGARAARASTASTWPARAGSTWSASPTTMSTASPPRWWRSWRLSDVRERKAQGRRRTPESPTSTGSRIAYLVQVSREMDRVEEEELVPARQAALPVQRPRPRHGAGPARHAASTHRHDAACGYYRSRPLLLALGVPLEDALGSGMAREGGYSDGRDIGAVFNYPNPDGAPGLADVRRRRRPIYADRGLGAGDRLSSATCSATAPMRARSRSCSAATRACATNGFWSALTIATTQKLPMLFYVEDNQYGISVPSSFQTPGGDIAKNLASFAGLHVLSGDGTEPERGGAADRRGGRPCPRRQGAGAAAPHRAAAPGPQLPGHPDLQERGVRQVRMGARSAAQAQGRLVGDEIWEARRASEARAAVAEARAEAEARGRRPIPRRVHRPRLLRRRDAAARAGSGPRAIARRDSTETPRPEGQRINMVTAIRRTLDHELEINPRVLLFGEDIGPKGGVHAVTLGLQEKFGAARVFDTSLSEEGIIGRAVGMALAGLMPVPEIQFRKYAEPALEQINDCGTMRWRTDNRFAAPMVLRMPGRLLQVRRSLAQPDQRGAVRPQSRLAGGGAVQCRGRGRAAALGAARQRSDRLLRASRDARRCLGAAALARRRLRPAVRPGEEGRARGATSPSSPGARWCRAARRRPRASRPT